MTNNISNLQTLLFSFLLTCSFTNSILVITPWTGGHFSFPLNIATALANSGHNVTFLAFLHDPNIPVSDNIKYVVLDNVSSEMRSFEYLNEVAVTSGALDGPSEKMIFRSIVGNPVMIGETLKQLKLRLDYVFREEMNSLIQKSNFDLMIVEETIYHPVAILARRFDIPLVTAIPVVDHQRARNEQNLPVLLTSEASQFLNIRGSTPPTFVERVELFLELGNFVLKLVLEIVDMMSGYLAADGLNSITDLDNVTQLYLVNDHPALSFPHLQAPNSLNMAGIGFTQDVKLLDGDVLQFINKANEIGKRIVLVSLGTLAFTLDHYNSMFGEEFLRNLATLDNVAVIVRSDREYPDLPDVLARPWLPQQALLASSSVNVIISSCGNSAKIEAVLHNVPLLCIPLFTDQYFNSLLVKQNNFGEMLVKEEFSHDRLKEILVRLLENGTDYRNKMVAASHAVLKFPGSPADRLVFYCNQLMEFGNLGYLRNGVIVQQSFVHVHNLDVFGVLFAALLIGTITILVLCKKAVNIGLEKIKTEKLD